MKYNFSDAVFDADSNVENRRARAESEKSYGQDKFSNKSGLSAIFKLKRPFLQSLLRPNDVS